MASIPSPTALSVLPLWGRGAVGWQHVNRIIISQRNGIGRGSDRHSLALIPLFEHIEGFLLLPFVREETFAVVVVLHAVEHTPR